MKKLLIIGVILSSLSLIAAEQTATPATFESSKLSKRDFLRLRAGGGKIERPGTKKGEIVIVNAQKTADKALIDGQVAYLTKETHYNITRKDGSFNMANPKVDGQMTIYIIEDAALPVILLAPENRWAMMNIATLKDDRKAFFEARVKKELSRTFAMLCGGMASNFQLSLMGPVTKTEDLDAFADAQIPFDIFNRMEHHLKKFGVEPARTATYRKACSEGWAPQPTNDVQRIIWEEMHSKPTEPMKIKFDPKKGE